MLFSGTLNKNNWSFLHIYIIFTTVNYEFSSKLTRLQQRRLGHSYCISRPHACVSDMAYFGLGLPHDRKGTSAICVVGRFRTATITCVSDGSLSSQLSMSPTSPMFAALPRRKISSVSSLPWTCAWSRRVAFYNKHSRGRNHYFSRANSGTRRLHL